MDNETVVQYRVRSMSATDTTIVNMNEREVSLPTTVRNRISKALREMGDYFESVPLERMFEILEANNVIPLQEDGTRWSGLLLGAAECGSDKAMAQRASIRLAFWDGQNEHCFRLARQCLHFTWGTRPEAPQARRWEVIKYVN